MLESASHRRQHRSRHGLLIRVEGRTTMVPTYAVQSVATIVLPNAQAFDKHGVDSALLTALGLAAMDVRGESLRSLRVDKEGHGREALADDLDVSRTVGWFTTLYPVTLRLATDPTVCLQRVRAQLAAFPPAAGFAYTRRHHATHVPSDFVYNYLGEGHDWGLNAKNDLDGIQPVAGDSGDVLTSRHCLNVVRTDDDRLVLTWVCACADDMQKWVERFRAHANAIALLDPTTPASPSSYVVLRAEGRPGRTPLWLAHPLSGSPQPYAELAARVAERPVYGLRYDGTGGSLSSIASHHLETIQFQQVLIC